MILICLMTGNVNFDYLVKVLLLGFLLCTFDFFFLLSKLEPCMKQLTDSILGKE